MVFHSEAEKWNSQSENQCSKHEVALVNHKIRTITDIQEEMKYNRYEIFAESETG